MSEFGVDWVFDLIVSWDIVVELVEVIGGGVDLVMEGVGVLVTF